MLETDNHHRLDSFLGNAQKKNNLINQILQEEQVLMQNLKLYQKRILRLRIALKILLRKRKRNLWLLLLKNLKLLSSHKL